MPAPFRYLVVRSGSTYAAVNASDEFSDWQQIEDRVVEGR
jgi:CRISPR/Cas system CMR subunit Cmr6 (Cas7 group RAMP superfamily)